MKLLVILLVVLLSCGLGQCNLLLRRPTFTNCTSPGYFCKDCKTRVVCVQTDSKGTFRSRTVETCTSPKKCVVDECTEAADPICDQMEDEPFVCGDIGMFPQPYNCRGFVMCYPDGDNFRQYRDVCDKGYGYNPKSTHCDVVLKDGECPKDSLPVPLCTKVGEIKALPTNPSIYYICKEYSAKKKALYPFQKRCPSGRIYRHFQCL